MKRTLRCPRCQRLFCGDIDDDFILALAAGGNCPDCRSTKSVGAKRYTKIGGQSR